MATPEPAKLTIAEALATNRGGVNIRASAIPDLTNYMEDVLGLQSGQDVFEELDVDGFIECFLQAEVFEDEVPVPMVASLKKWYFDASYKTPSPMAKKTAHKSGSGLAIEKEVVNLLSTATNMDMDNDMKAMNLDAGEITTLALSIETGQVHTEYDVIEVAYGSDPCLTEVARQRRKAGLESLSKLVAAKDGRGISVHFASLIRDLNADGRSKEVSVITSWLMEAQQVFGDDSSAFVAYVKEYLRRYKGRAFPVKFDFALFAKSIGTAKGGLTEDQKEALNKGRKAAKDVETLTLKVQSLTDAVRDMKKKMDSDTGDKKKFTCNFCGMEGHTAARCKANPDSPSFDAKFAKKFEEKKKGDEE